MSFTQINQVFIIIIIIICLTILSISIFRYTTYKCEQPVIEYKFVPRTFEQEQREPLKAGLFFADMFESPSVNAYGIPLGLNAERKMNI